MCTCTPLIFPSLINISCCCIQKDSKATDGILEWMTVGNKPEQEENLVGAHKVVFVKKNKEINIVIERKQTLLWRRKMSSICLHQLEDTRNKSLNIICYKVTGLLVVFTFLFFKFFYIRIWNSSCGKKNVIKKNRH